MIQTNTQQTPEKLVEKLKETIIGQDRYLKDLCTSVWLHSLRRDLFLKTGEHSSSPKLNMLVLGKSGSGKTSTIQAFARELDLCTVIEDASLFTGTGWKGKEVTSIIKDVTSSARDRTQADHAIVVLDEIDKIFVNNADNPSFPATNNFLKLIEGAHLTHEENQQVYQMDTSNLLFICLGAFDGLDEIILRRMQRGKKRIGFCSEPVPDEIENIFTYVEKQDLIDYGINPQFLGRISMITTTNELTAADMEQILLNSRLSAVRQFDALLYSSMGVHVAITQSAAKCIAKKACSAGTGARALMSEVTEAFKPGLYQIAGREDIRELRLDHDPQKGLTLDLISGERKTGMPSSCDDKTPHPDISAEDWVSLPFELESNNLPGLLQYMEEIAEQYDIYQPQLAFRYSYREFRAAVYMLGAAFFDVIISDRDRTLYEVLISLNRFKESISCGTSWQNAMTLQRLYQKSLLFEPNQNKTIRFAYALLENHGTVELEAIELNKEEDDPEV